MYLSEERKAQLLARHCVLMDLTKYLEVKDENQWLNFEKNVFLLEKNLESSKDPSYAQSLIFTNLLATDKQLKKVILSKEWQKANEIFSLAHNATDLLDAFYQLEIGNLDCTEKNKLLRQKLIRNAFFLEDAKGQVHYGNINVCFVFSETTPRWAVENIEWTIQEKQGESVLVGIPYISLGMPKPDGNPMYRELYALLGSELHAVVVLGVQGLIWNNQSMRVTAQEVWTQLPNDLDKMKEIAKKLPNGMQEMFQEWLKQDILERELSKSNLSFLTDMLYYFLQSNCKQEYDYLMNRFSEFGFRLDKVSQTSGYDFSDTVALGEIIHSKPTISCYIPKDNVWEELCVGTACLSAGAMPEFLQEICNLTKKGKLAPHPEDLKAVKELFLFIQFGDKVPKPPILPIYNALRRWLDELANHENFKGLEKLCHLAKAMRPYIVIPTLGEVPESLVAREHKLISKFDPTQKPGVIIAIKKAGILVPGDRMPLCLPGVYWVARPQSCLEKLLEMIDLIENKSDEMKNAIQTLKKNEDEDAFLCLVQSLCQYAFSNSSKLKEEQWDMLCQTVEEWNQHHEKQLVFLPFRKISYENFVKLEEKRYHWKFSHTLKVDEGIIISQEPNWNSCSIVVGSGISPKLLQAIMTVDTWAKEHNYDKKHKLDSLRSNMMSFLLLEENRLSLENLVQFCKSIEDSSKIKEELDVIDEWLNYPKSQDSK